MLKGLSRTKVVAIAAALLLVILGYERLDLGPAGGTAPDETRLFEAYQKQQSGVQVTGRGRVTRILPDDNDGSRHQRFVLELASGQTLLVAHNIDLARRLSELREGDTVAFSGEYEWNEQGGVLHWTHHDPAGTHPGGWLEHRGKHYE